MNLVFPTKSALCNAANWPDTVKGIPAYRQTIPDHYMSSWEDKEIIIYDTPLLFAKNKCSLIPVDETSCPGGHCIIQALYRHSCGLSKEFEFFLPHLEMELFNQNQKFTFADKKITTKFKESLMFILHLMGDAHQPLHLCGKEKGGIERMVLYNGKLVDLHSIWDTHLLSSKIELEYNGSYEEYSLELLSQDRPALYNEGMNVPAHRKIPILSQQWFTQWTSNVINSITNK